MKKIIRLTGIITLITVKSMAQLPTGSIAPDWTFTDINGISHHLYADLDAGKTVFLDLSTTWCEGCWLYHIGGKLDSLWKNHGPIGAPGVNGNSTNDILLYFIECDESTNHACLIGDTVNCSYLPTLGDWVTGVDYPIIDPPSPDIDVFNTNYQNNGYPTFFVICPDRSITCYENSPPYPDMYAAANCAPAFSGTDARMRLMELYPPILETCDSVAPEFSLSNNGTTVLTSADITFKVDGAFQKLFHWTGNLATYNDALITGIKVGSLTPGGHTVTSEVSNPNGITDPNSANNTAALSFNIYPSAGSFVAESFEASGMPASWTIGNGGQATTTWTTATTGYNSSKSTLLNWYDIPVTGAEVDETDILTMQAQSFAGAASASLTFDIAYCESFIQNSSSLLQVEVSTDCGATWVSKYLKSGATLATTTYNYNAFVPSTASEWRHETVNLTSVAGQPHVLIRFKANLYQYYNNNLYIDNINVTTVAGIEENSMINNVSVYPNPITNTATVDFNLTESGNVSIALVNELGQAVLKENLGRFSSGKQKYLLSIKSVPNGVYLLNIKAGQSTIIKKVSINK